MTAGVALLRLSLHVAVPVWDYVCVSVCSLRAETGSCVCVCVRGPVTTSGNVFGEGLCGV